eukprot:TRINITY_DN3425_c0_g2_i1.p1 TRINITY_DN3425_c0_g2~~TRINITY_DN3425_c0_g2_i1.p1  ORF type:complete len:437 (+),score=42.62 TRINITY_DN3425_c0_g2_i1:310-1620(+)
METQKWSMIFLFTLLFAKTYTWSCKIGILDFMDFADGETPVKEERLLNCLKNAPKPLKVSQSPHFLHADTLGIMNGTHNLGAHIEAVTLVNKVRAEQEYVPVEDADLVLVDDFCFMFQFAPGYPRMGYYTVDMFERLRQTERWRRNNGADFVFVRGYPMEGNIFDDDYVCEYLYRSYFVFYEWQRFLGTCDRQKRQMGFKTIHMPYIANIVGKNIPKPQDRGFLLSFFGSCSSTRYENNFPLGNKIRFVLYKGLKYAPDDVKVDCPCIKVQNNQQVCHKEKRSHIDVLQQYHYSKYCFVIAGDSESSLRLTEVVLAGCVPIFVGEPFHALPFKQQIDYRQFGLFFRLENLPFVSTKQESLFVPQDQVTNVANAMEIVDYLRSLPDYVYEQKYWYVLQKRSLFEYVPNPSGYPSAIDTIIENLCEMYHMENNAKYIY